MQTWLKRPIVSLAAAGCIIAASALCAPSMAERVGFDSNRWVKPAGRTAEYLGRQALAGVAYLQDVEFENGTIEVDIAVTGARSYPGIRFRMQGAGDYEECYVRPHRAGLYPDAVQYTPVTNGISSWQLYNGEGYTSAADITPNRWTRLKIEVLGDQARVYLGDSPTPVLVIDRLAHGVTTGGIGVSGPMDGSAYFSEFAYHLTDDLEFASPVPVDTAPGMITEWELSRSFPVSALDLESYPLDQDLGDPEWMEVSAGPRGLVDVARYRGRTTREPECVLARTVVNAAEAGRAEYRFGYSDWMGVYLNGDLLFQGNSAYRARDPSFLGIVGLFDALYLPLEEGENYLVLVVAESFGGWGFMCRDATAVFEHVNLTKAWETDRDFRVPESVAYDPASGALYVSNYDMYNPGGQQGGQSISKVSLDGDIMDLDWAVGLRNPTGMEVHGDRLYAVERGGVAEIDTDTGEVLAVHSAVGRGFLNDAAVDETGKVYVSDSRSGVICRLGETGLETWLESPEILQPNGLHVSGSLLLVGNNGDGSLKSVDIRTKEVAVVARLGDGTIDGIASDEKGNYIVSHWEGRVYRVSPDGRKTKLLDLTGPGRNCADLTYIRGARLMVIPGFVDNRVTAYRVDG